MKLREEEFYEQYHQHGGTTIIPTEIFNELYDDATEEIERLNNIINDLEKFMDEDYEYYEKYGYAEQGHAMGEIRRIKNKLQELKGSGNEWVK